MIIRVTERRVNEGNISNLVCRLRESLEKARDQSKISVPVGSLAGPLKVSSHLADSPSHPANDVVIIDAEEGPFVLYGVSKFIKVRTTQSKYIEVSLLRNVTEEDLQYHYSLIVLVTQLYFRGAPTKLLLAYTARREELHPEDVRLYLSLSISRSEKRKINSSITEQPEHVKISGGRNFLGDIFYCCVGSVQPSPVVRKRKERPSTPHPAKEIIKKKYKVLRRSTRRRGFSYWDHENSPKHMRAYGSVVHSSFP